ncbi:hypothetical protein [Jannaschia aquimarina]|uniref:Uncharacterized protein n=1 Tax=Jannaschia aquimarina TaxID=935700 RepID=A0A0D1CHW8_9RHOB|nr:hypothetical protein [Jannaschia aquimarina]KIT14272.1 hypothetical protein jaqu_40660 [Jannaschia aquimarina]SNS49701.1 hypothetical protein SAMN05421775_101185 [Jannaschia aquimarina]
MSRTRFIDAAAEAARTERPVLPWTRGARRAEMIARRKAATKPKKATVAAK